MIIRKSQLETFSETALSGFITRLSDALQTAFPDAQNADPVELRNAVAAQVSRAVTYGIDTEQDVSVYVTTAYQLGEDFDTEFPAAQEVLPSPVLTSGEKALWLSEWSGELFRALDGERA